MAAFIVLKDLETVPDTVETPLETADCERLAREIAVVPVLRAGLGMMDGFIQVVPEARVGFMGLYRNENTLEPVDYYRNLPDNLSQFTVVLLDPMLATGGSAVASVEFLKKTGARDLRFFCLVAAPEGVENVLSHHPDLEIFTVALDRELNDRGYILPGLGDAGDRLFGTEL